MTHRLIYSSEAADTVSDADLRMIAMFSRMNNRRQNIAGLLLHHKGYIVQVLEGPKGAVQNLFANIKADSRHKNIKTLMDRPCDQQIFAEWSMGFRPMENRDEIDAFFKLSKKSLNEAFPSESEEEVRQVLCDFTKISGLS